MTIISKLLISNLKNIKNLSFIEKTDHVWLSFLYFRSKVKRFIAAYLEKYNKTISGWGNPYIFLFNTESHPRWSVVKLLPFKICVFPLFCFVSSIFLLSCASSGIKNFLGAIFDCFFMAQIYLIGVLSKLVPHCTSSEKFLRGYFIRIGRNLRKWDYRGYW